jgi:hypothetical protein
MSINNPFFLRSDGGAIFMKVANTQVTEICLFSGRVSFESYSLNVQQLVNKVQLFTLKEIDENQFLKAQTEFLTGVGVLEPVVDASPPPTAKQIEQAAIVADALKEDLPF